MASICCSPPERALPATLVDRVEADLLGVADALRQIGEGLAVVEVGRVHDVSGRAKSVREGDDPRGQSLCVMKEQNLGQGSDYNLERAPRTVAFT